MLEMKIQRLERVMRFFAFVIVIFPSLCANVLGEDLEPLTELTWSAKGSVDDETEVDLALALSAQGKRFSINYSTVLVNVAPTYDSPLDACAATIRAGIELNENWWGGLSAPWSARDEDGLPLASYMPDSTENLYTAFTYHTEDSTVGRPTDAQIKAYLRVGGAHVFDIEWTEVCNGETTTGIRYILPFQEGPSGRYRFAPEWLDAFDGIKDYLTRTEPETAALAAYRTANSDTSHSIPVYQLFGGEGISYPLTIHFRGSPLSDSPNQVLIADFRASYIDAVSQVPTAVEEFGGSDARDLLADLHTASGLAMLDELGYHGRIRHPFGDSPIYVIDSPDYVLLFHKGNESVGVARGFVSLYKDGPQFRWTNFNTTNLLDSFLGSPTIWPALNSYIESQMAQGE